MSSIFAQDTEAIQDPWRLPTAKTQSEWATGEHNEEEIISEDQNGITNQEQSVWSLDHNGDTDVHEDIPENTAAVDISHWVNGIRDSFTPLPQDIIIITEIPEKEGILFKHTNYIVKHLVPLPEADSSNDRKVVRRYSDFHWLFETLLKKYPFRLIPDLPPKKLTVNSSADSTFLIKRRQGLQRFINQIMNHPILKKDDLVVMFLTVPTDLSSWRKQANYDSTEEYLNKKISYEFIQLWENNDSIRDAFKTFEGLINDSLENWAKLTILIERLNRRYQQIIKDDEIFGQILNGFKQSVSKVYSFEDRQATIIDIQTGLGSVETHHKKQNDLLVEETTQLEDDTLQNFKKFGDYLNSFRFLIERFKRNGGNEISQLTKRLKFNEDRLKELNSKADVKGFEIDRLQKAITDDQVEIQKQTNRDWLIKESIITEYILFQETQFQITSVFKNWTKDKLKYAELSSNNWNDLLTSLNDTPLSRSHY